MNIESILAGGFLGAMFQQAFVMLNNHQAFKREKSKVLYQNKLVNGERLIGSYVGIYYHIRTILASINAAKEAFNNDVIDLDYDGVETTLKTALIKVAECEEKIVLKGASAYLYYNITTDWTDIDFRQLFSVCHSLTPKVERLNQLLLDEEGSQAHLLMVEELNSDLDILIANLNKYKTATESTIAQLKLQAKS